MVSELASSSNGLGSGPRNGHYVVFSFAVPVFAWVCKCINLARSKLLRKSRSL